MCIRQMDPIGQLAQSIDASISISRSRDRSMPLPSESIVKGPLLSPDTMRLADTTISLAPPRATQSMGNTRPIDKDPLTISPTSISRSICHNSGDPAKSLSPLKKQHNSKTIASFVWNIPEIYPLNSPVKSITSSSFDLMDVRISCLMWLEMHPHGCQDHLYSNFCVSFYTKTNDIRPKSVDILQVTIALVRTRQSTAANIDNKTDLTKGRTRLSKQCILSLSMSLQRRWWQRPSSIVKESVHFPMNELAENQMLVSNTIAIECIVGVIQ